MNGPNVSEVNLASMDGQAISPLTQLKQAMERLYGCPIENDFTVLLHDRMTGLIAAYNYLRNISYHFQNINPSLSNAWGQTAEFTKKISDKIDVLMRSLMEEMQKFIETTASYEQEINNAVINANNKAEELLKKLGL